MQFTPTAEKLIPDLTPREELVILARTLWREGYDDHIAGHITYRQPDGTFLCNPWYLLWSELRAEHVIRIDIDGPSYRQHVATVRAGRRPETRTTDGRTDTAT